MYNNINKLICNLKTFMFILIKIENITQKNFIDYCSFSDDEELKFKINLIRNSNNNDIDYLLPISSNDTYFNINYLTCEQSDTSKSNLKLIKHPINIFILQNMRLLIALTGNLNVTNLIKMSFKKTFNFIKLNNKDSFYISNTQKNILKASQSPFLTRRSSKEADIVRSISRFHNYEMDSKYGKKLLQKINLVNQSEDIECEDEDESPIQNREFKFEELFYCLFLSSLNNIQNFTENLHKEEIELKQTYLELTKLTRKPFYSQMSRLEECLDFATSELGIKEEFLDKISEEKKYIEKFYIDDNYNNIKKFTRQFVLYLEQLIGKLRESKIILNNIETSLQMIKKTFKIILDDNHRQSDTRMSQVMFYLMVISTLLIPIFIIASMLTMNVKIPISKVTDTHCIAFIVMTSGCLCVVTGQYFILKWWKWI